MPKMVVTASDFYDLGQIVNLLEDAGYISYRVANRFDCATPPRYVEIPEKDCEEVKTLLRQYLGSQKYPYRGYYCGES